MIIGWIVAALVLGIVELLTVDLFFLTLAIASLLAGGSAALGLPIWAQITVFVVASILMLLLVRPWARRHLAKTTPDVATNAQGLVGKIAIVTRPLLGPAGRVRLDGEEWSAKGHDGAVFPVGTQVRVVNIEGATAVVGPLGEHVPTPSDTSPPQSS